MTFADHLPVLKRTGFALVIVGILDIVFMVYATVNRVYYVSSFNIVAVVAGVFLLRGSLIAASLVRWFALFLLAALLSMALVALALQPIDLTLTQLQINPLEFLGYFALVALAFMFFVWLARELGSAPVLLARKNAGLPRRKSGFPLALGIAPTLVFGLVGFYLEQSDPAVSAVREARTQLGDDYRFHVSSFRYRSFEDGKSMYGVVTAWKDGSIKELPFMWRK